MRIEAFCRKSRTLQAAREHRITPYFLGKVFFE